MLARCPVQLGAAEVEGRREVELLLTRGRGLGEGPVVRRAIEGWRAGAGAGRGRGGLEIGQAAGFGAVGCAIGLLVASEAELVGPVERHGGGGGGV